MADISDRRTTLNGEGYPDVDEVAPPTVPPPVEPPRRGRAWTVVAVVVLLGVAAYLFWPKKPAAPSSTESPKAAAKGGRGGFGAIPVVAVKARKGDINVFLNGLGNIFPVYTVTVKSRVDGQLMQVLYKEGQLVHQGDRLVEIDPRPYEAQLTQFQGLLERDQALLENARVDLARYQTLVKQNAAPEQQLATQQSLVTQLEGTVKNDQGQIDATKVNLAYCHIDAPITGVVGLRLVDPGNIVHATDTNGLLVITQVQPISMVFTIAEDQLPAVRQKLLAGQRLEVDAYNRDMTTKIAQGWLETIDNQIDPTTGSLRLRAIFPNADNALFPNQFVNARLLVDRKHDVTLLATAAIQRGATSTYVFAVKPDSTVTVRQVTVGTTEGDDTEVTSGVLPGDTIVMTGVDKLMEGTKVAVHFAEQQGREGASAQAGQPNAGTPNWQNAPGGAKSPGKPGSAQGHEGRGQGQRRSPGQGSSNQ